MVQRNFPDGLPIIHVAHWVTSIRNTLTLLPVFPFGIDLHWAPSSHTIRFKIYSLCWWVGSLRIQWVTGNLEAFPRLRRNSGGLATRESA